MNKSILSELTIKLTGKDYALTTNKYIVKMCGGDFTVAMLLSQLTYWNDKKQDSLWIYKTDLELSEELGTSKKRVSRAKLKLRELGLIDTRIMKIQNAPTTHYRINTGKFSELFTKSCGLSDAKCTKGVSGNVPKVNLENNLSGISSITKNTTKNTTYIANHKDEPNGSEAIYLNNSDITKPLIISSSDAPNLCLSCSYEELPNFEGPVIMGCKSAMPFKNRKMFWRDSTYPIKCEAFKLKVNSKPEAREQAVNQTTVKQNKGATSNQQAIEPFLNHNCQAKSKPSQEKKPVRLKKFDEAEINLFKLFADKFLAKTGMKYHSAKYFADLTNCKSILKRAENSKIDLDRVIDYLLSDKIFEGYNKNIQTLNKHLENFAVELKSANCKDDGSLSSRQANQTTEEAQRDLDRMEAHQKMIRENKKGGQNE